MARKFDINEMPSSLTSVGGVAGGASNRQAILQGSVNSTTGVPNFLSIGTGLAVNLSATAVPLIMSFAAGFDTTTGALTYVGSLTADVTGAWSSLTNTATNYLYVDRNTSTGALTRGAVTLAPVYQAFAPTNTNGQHWFDTSTMTMKSGNGTVWTAVQRVFVGHAVASGGAITSVTSYGVGGTVQGATNTFISGYQASQSVATSTLTTMTFTVTADPTNEWNTGSSRFTVSQKGRYIVKFLVNCGSVSASALIYKNGSSLTTNFVVMSSSYNINHASAALELNPGDFLEFKTQHAFGSNVNITSDMFIAKVG